MATRNIFGEGLSFPPRVAADGRLAWSAGEDNVREAVRVLLMTEPRERLMRDSYGCGLRPFLAEPNTPATRALIRARIVEAIDRWEPRVDVQEVTVEDAADDARMVSVVILFRLIATQAIARITMTLQLEG